MSTIRPLLLCILDGWGISSSQKNNGIAMAKTPHWDRFLKNYPHHQLQASELFVGLPHGQMGNSEVGHMTIEQAGHFARLPRIDVSLEEHTLEHNPKFLNFIEHLKTTKGHCHIMGLLSPGGVHSHQRHMEAIVNLLKMLGIPMHVHAFLDGRDTPPQSAIEYLQEFQANTNHPLSTIGGRYYVMDRDKRWDRVEKAYQAIVHGQGIVTNDPETLLKDHYKQGGGDEFLQPHVLPGYDGIHDGDGVFMINFRADRVRQFLSALLLPEFDAFPRSAPPKITALGMGEYSTELTPYIPSLFPKEQSLPTIGSLISEAGLKQLRIAETEKYAHVTFFINGGREAVFPGEDREMIPSPDVATYDLKPEMSALQVTDHVVEAINRKKYELIIMNYANTDMVGHTGVQPAILHAVETIDGCLGRLEEVAVKNDYTMIVTADHGNVEQMIDEATGEPHTAHTCNPVPFLVMNVPISQVHDGQLSDIAPTILSLMGLPIPDHMTGHSLVEKESHDAMAF